MVRTEENQKISIIMLVLSIAMLAAVLVIGIVVKIVSAQAPLPPLSPKGIALPAP